MNRHLAGPRRWAQAVTLAVASATALAVVGCGGDSAESLLASGQAMAAKKDYKAAVIQFKAALQKDPQSGEARYLLGKALLDSSDPTSAAVELSKALDQKVDAAKVVPALARAYLLTGEHKKITTLYGDLQLDDKQAQASLKSTVATAWAAQGDREKTLAAAAAALREKPDYPPALVLQARILAGQGQFDEAIALVDRALQLDASLYGAWHLKGEILAYVKRDEKGAAAAFQKALSVEPAYIASHLAIINARMAARDLPGAQAQAAQLRKLLPTHPQTVYVDAQLAFASRDLQKARELTQTLLRAGPENAPVQLLAGAVEAQLGSLVLAESHFAKALQLNPRLLVARRNLGQIYLRLGQPQKALDTLKPLLAANVNDAETYAIAGEAHLALGDAKGAEAAFRQAVSIKPDNSRVKTALALTHLTRGDADTAFEELEVIAGQSKQDTFANQAIISARLSRREYDQALKAADAMVAKASAKGSALEMRGRIQLLRKDYVAARKDFELALQADPALFSATVNLAGLDSLEKKPEQARQRLEASIQAEPRNHYARLALAELRLREGAPLVEIKPLLEAGIKASPTEPALRLQLIEVLLSKRQLKDALAAAQEASTAMPADLRLLDALGRAQMEAGDVEQSISTFRRIAEADPRSSTPYMRLADIYGATSRQAAAETALRKALEVEPSSVRAQEALAVLMLASKRYPQAIELARSVQRQRPRAAGGYVFEASVLLSQNQVGPALAVYKRGLAVKDHEPELARQYYLTLLRTGRSAEADQFGASWIRANPSDLVFDYQLAVSSMQRKDFDQAEARLQRIVQQRPQYSMALNNLAWVLASRGKPGGVAFAQRALALAPDKPEFMDTLAIALMVDKQPTQALALQKRVVELRPTEPAYRLSLARIALEAGDKVTAKAELERLKALGSTYPQQAEVTALSQKL